MTNKTVSPHQQAILVGEAYQQFAAAVATMNDERSWLPTECVGWSVRDLVFHCLGDAQRGLVALHTPAHMLTGRAADRDAVTYWADWQPDPTAVGAAAGRRFIRVVASMFLRVEQLSELYVETATALVHAAKQADPDELVATQGHVLTAGDLLSTLAVEATIHHLDLAASLCDGPDTEAMMPAPSGLAEVRRTLDGLLGQPVPLDWDDATYARKGTGRAPLSLAERQQLGALADRFPLFC